MTSELRDAGNLQKYFASIPHLISDDERLTREDRALYLYYKRVAGETSTCFKSNKTIKDEAGFGLTLLRECQTHLVETGYINVEERAGMPTLITIVDVWDANFAAYAPPRVASTTPPPNEHPPHRVASEGNRVASTTPPAGGDLPHRVASTKKNPTRKIPEEKSEEEKSQQEPGLFGADLLANRDELIILFEKTVGLVQPIIHDELLALRDRDHFSMEWIAAAFEKSRGKSLAYARGILRRWEMQGHMDAPKVDAQTKAIEAAPESARAQFLRRYQEREGARKGIPA